MLLIGQGFTVDFAHDAGVVEIDEVVEQRLVDGMLTDGRVLNGDERLEILPFDGIGAARVRLLRASQDRALHRTGIATRPEEDRGALSWRHLIELAYISVLDEGQLLVDLLGVGVADNLLQERGVVEEQVPHGRSGAGVWWKTLPSIQAMLHLPGGVRLAGLLVGLSRARRTATEVGEVDAAQRDAEEVAVLDRHARTVGGVRRGGVGGVAGQGDPPLRPLASAGRSRSTQRWTLAGSVAATSAGQRGGETRRRARRRPPCRSAGGGAAGSAALSTHHWKPARPW